MKKEEAPANERLRHLIVGYYRSQPWGREPTLKELKRFASFTRPGEDVVTLIDRLIARHGLGLELGDLRLQHLIDVE
jgi:hypothetical protein